MFEITCIYVDTETNETIHTTPRVVNTTNAEALICWIEAIYAKQYAQYATDRRVDYEVNFYRPTVINMNQRGTVWEADNAICQSAYCTMTDTRQEGLDRIEAYIWADTDK